MSFILNEAVVRKALLLELESQIEAIPASFYEPHSFSKRFERKMKKLIKCAQRPLPLNRAIRFSKKTAIVLLAALLASLATIMSISAWRESLFRFVQHKFPKYSVVFYEPISSESKNMEANAFIAYSPTYIPEGFKMTNENRRGRVQLRYENSGSSYITYRQVLLGKTELRINTEGAEIEPIDFLGYQAYYYSNIGNHSLMWDDGNYSFMVASNTDKNTVLKIAESIKIENS